MVRLNKSPSHWQQLSTFLTGTVHCGFSAAHVAVDISLLPVNYHTDFWQRKLDQSSPGMGEYWLAEEKAFHHAMVTPTGQSSACSFIC